MTNHYKWLEKNLPDFMNKLGIDFEKRCCGIITAHGDKCDSYKSRWSKAGIPFPHGVAIYFLSYLKPFSEEVRQTESGFVEVGKWVIDNYPKFKQFLPNIPNI